MKLRGLASLDLQSRLLPFLMAVDLTRFHLHQLQLMLLLLFLYSAKQARQAQIAGLVIAALEDNDVSDDTATWSCKWVLSLRDKPKLNGLVLIQSVTTSTAL